MAKNTTLKTRIQNRHDTEANWTTASNATNPFIPLKGEVIVYDPDIAHTAPRVKIGDGVTKVGNLAFVGGDLSKYVTLDTAQTITATKTFQNCNVDIRGGRIYAENRVLSHGEIESYTSIGDDSDNKPAKAILIDSNGDLNTDSSMYLEYRTQFGALSVPTYYKKLKIGSEIPLATSTDTSDVVNTIKFPFKSGTVALLSDIPSIPTNYVTTDTEQTINGIKTFTEGLKVDSIKTTNNVVLLSTNSIATTVSNSSRRLILCGNEARPKYSLNSGSTATEIALLSDIPTLNSTTLTGLMTGSNGITVADKDNKVDISFTNSPTFYNQTEEEGYVAINESYMGLGPQLRVCANTGADYTIMSPDRYSIYVGDMEASIYGVYDNTDNSTYLYINSTGTSLGRILTTKDLDTAPTKVKDTFVASSWATSSAATDTQFGKYYKDVTIPNKNIINVRCVSTKGMSGITLDYAPEIKCNNRRTSDTNLRIYSNSQLEGAVTITLVGDTLPNKFSKTNAILSASSWTTSSATVDTQFAKYYTDITVPAGDVMNIRILSNEDITGISTAAYYPEVWNDNRKINSTTLRVYSNKQVAGLVIILTMEV